MTKKQKGFSLIELLIVVAIILIIAAIAIPNLIRARIAANESSAVGSLRTINTAEVTYATGYPLIGFTSLTALGGAAPCTSASSTAACLIDEVLAAGSKSGYTFTTTAAAGSGTSVNVTYTSQASPQATSTGKRYFHSDESGVVRFNLTGTATSADSPI